MANTASNPRLFPEPVPGGSVIGSIDSAIFATFSLNGGNGSVTQNTSSIRSKPPTYTSFNSDASRHLDSFYVEDISKTIQNLSRAKIEGLVTQAWIRNIPNQSEEKLRDLVASAVKRGILTNDDVQSSFANSFTGLPTDVLPLWTLLIVRFNFEFCRIFHCVNG